MILTASAHLLHAAFDPAAELSAFTSGTAGAGAVASFTGLVRPGGAHGGAVERLFLDHHPVLTQRSLEEIAGAALARFDLLGTRVVHRCGLVLAGEPIVFAAAAAAHRRAALDAVDCMMDRLKTEAIFWKREDSVDGSHWIEPTNQDRADRARGSDTCPGSTTA